ncbi:hypothetical protein RCN02_04110 [Escherichia coli]|nr:hypothetical protein [Escherichia coli]
MMKPGNGGYNIGGDCEEDKGAGVVAGPFVLMGQLMLTTLTLKLAGSLPSLMAWSRMR